jgi:hypothetical protein
MTAAKAATLATTAPTAMSIFFLSMYNTPYFRPLITGIKQSSSTMPTMPTTFHG